MNAPLTAAPVIAQQQSIPLDEIVPSPTNPRKRFDPAALEELTDSVRKHGVITPVLVRAGNSPTNPRVLWELVAGERRYRAAKAAGLQEIPAVIRSLTDSETLELQVVENLQRDDLHPIEEAEGYERLMKRHQYTVEQIAAKVGKSRSYVYLRLKLLELCPKARDAAFDGALDASHALLIARIPTDKLQLEAVKEFTRGGELISYRSAVDLVQRRFMLRLADAPFNVKDAELIPRAGSCGECPKRSGNQPELFSDVRNADVCTDTSCFAEKKSAHFAQVRAAAEASGQKVLRGDAAKKILPHEHSHYVAGGYTRTDDTIYIGNKSEKVATLAKKVGLEPTLVERPKSDGELVAVVSETALRAALKKAGLVKDTPDPTRAREARERDKRKVEVAARARIFEGLCGRLTFASAFTDADDVVVASGVWDAASYENRVAFALRWGWADSKPVEWATLAKCQERIAKLTPPELWRLMLELTCYPDIDAHEKPARLEALAIRHGVDVVAIRREASAASKSPVAKPRSKKAPAKAAPAKRKPKAPTKKAQANEAESPA